MATHCRWDLLHTPLPADADIAWLGSYRRYTARLTMDRLTIAIAPQQTDRHPLQPHAFSLQPHAPTPACSPTLAPRAYLPATPCAHRSACNPMCPSFHLQPYVPIRLQPHVPICLQPHVPIVPPATLCAYPPAAARAHAPCRRARSGTIHGPTARAASGARDGAGAGPHRTEGVFARGRRRRCR